MAEFSFWTVSDVLSWLDTAQLGQYKKLFKKLKIDGSLLPKITLEDLETDFHIQDHKDRLLILQSISSLFTIKEPLKIRITLKFINDTKVDHISYPLSPNPATIALNLPDYWPKHCEILYEGISNRFFIKDLGNSQGVYLKLKKSTKIYPGMIFTIGSIKICVKNIWYKVGIPSTCKIKVYDGPEIEFGAAGCSIGKSSRNTLVLKDDCVANVHAIINNEFALESFHSVFLKLTPGMFYPFVIGDVVKVEDLYKIIICL
jgi:SAM domain (Sterile alpha motif)/FHA domain